MSVTPTDPGVSIEEGPGGDPSIIGVETAIGAFVDFFPEGPVGEAVMVRGWADFERRFGGLDARSEASYAIQQFFLNGGSRAYVVRTTSTSDDTWDPLLDAAGVAGGLIGDELRKTGIYTLADVDLFNILCIPATALLPDIEAARVAAGATAFCTRRRAFYILDAPQQDADRDTIDGIQAWLCQNPTLRGANAALYFPRVDIADPLNNDQLRPTAPSGTIAGVYARTDANRGVWKAPAGPEASLVGVQGLEYELTDDENSLINSLAINGLRSFPGLGPVCWGARTLHGTDPLESAWKYVPVRRFALFLEESLDRGTKWVVFEPNDESLWARIRLSVGAFMQDLFRQGAFEGNAPRDAYFVKCDNETTTQADIDDGVVNIVVGFAPLRPAEFIILTIQQFAGQSPT
jgi:phage tail sheath protein FI